MNMRTGAFALTYVVCIGLVCGAQFGADEVDDTDIESMKALATALLATNPGNVAAHRHMASQMASGRHAKSSIQMAEKNKFNEIAKGFVKQGITAGLTAALVLGGGMQAAQAGPFTTSELNSLTYEQIKGTGLANTCPRVEGNGKGISTGNLKRMSDFCLEPLEFGIVDNGKFEKDKVTTRQTYTLTGIDGDLATNGGKLTFTEKDGIDYAATTIQRPGGERVPFLFTVKNLVAQATTSAGAIEPGLELGGSFKVPSYRTGLFLDPKGRGMTTGYDQAVALPALQAGGDEKMFNENNKKFDVLDGNIQLKVTSVNNELGEVGGVFVHNQPSDTDLGGKQPLTVQLKGVWFAKVE